MAQSNSSLPSIAGAVGNENSNWRQMAGRWRRLSGDSRSIIAVALLAALVAAAIVVILWTSNSQYVPLYGKQEMYDTAAMLEVLEAEGIDFKLDDRAGTVMVSKDKVASARMKLAARGVTAKMPTGLEGLSDMSALSTSQFMESTRYTHAVEGELAVSIMSLTGVRSARVHLAIPKRTLFVGRDEQVPTASVMLDLDGNLQETQVEAIINLVAGSITGLKPGAVSVIDQSGRLLSAGLGAESPGRVSSRQLDYVSQLERRIASRAEDMLEPMLGNENFRIRVAANVDFSQVEETREVLDGKPILLSETSVVDNTTNPLGMGIPGALANQPPEPADPDAEEGGAQNTENRREELSRRFETGRAVTHTRFGETRLNSFALSVLVNDGAAPEGGWTDAQIEKMSEMVKIAAGLVPARGDTFSLQTAPFVVTSPSFPEPQAALWWEDLSPWASYIRYGLGALMLLLLIIFGIRPLVNHLTRSAAGRGENQHETIESAASDDEMVEADTKPAMALAERRAKERAELEQKTEEHALRLPPPGSELEVQLQHLRLLADKETARVADVIKAWVHENGRTNS